MIQTLAYSRIDVFKRVHAPPRETAEDHGGGRSCFAADLKSLIHITLARMHGDHDGSGPSQIRMARATPGRRYKRIHPCNHPSTMNIVQVGILYRPLVPPVGVECSERPRVSEVTEVEGNWDIPWLHSHPMQLRGSSLPLLVTCLAIMMTYLCLSAFFLWAAAAAQLPIPALQASRRHAMSMGRTDDR